MENVLVRAVHSGCRRHLIDHEPAIRFLNSNKEQIAMKEPTSISHLILMLSLVPVSACTPSADKDVGFRDVTDTDPDCDDPTSPPIDPDALYPSAPSAEKFMWQGVQTDFHKGSGEPWKGKIVLSVGDQAVCYMAADKQLKCAGRVYQQNWGSAFVGTGIFDPDQVYISETSNYIDGNGMCVLVGGILKCMGRNNYWGNYGVGHTNPVSTLTQWGSQIGITHFDYDYGRLCAIKGVNQIYCAGIGSGSTPALHPVSANGLYLDSYSPNPHTDTGTVWRNQNFCSVTDGGLRCDLDEPYEFGTPGEVVDGGIFGGRGLCWLTTDGEVLCADDYGCTTKHFTERPVLAIAGNYWALDPMCAVYNDGSLSCIGSNQSGMFGTGNQDPLAEETVVQPPGSVYLGTGCDPGCASGSSCEAGECVQICGDGLLGADEECDDGGTSSNDGCSSTCRLEFQWINYGDPTVSLPNYELKVEVLDVKITPGYSKESYVHLKVTNLGRNIEPQPGQTERIQIDISGPGPDLDKLYPTCHAEIYPTLTQNFNHGAVKAGWIPCTLYGEASCGTPENPNKVWGYGRWAYFVNGGLQVDWDDKKFDCH